MHDRWIAQKEELLDLTPLSEDEDLAAWCNSNFWIVSYDKHGIQVVNNGYHLTLQHSFDSPIVVKRVFWCPGCMKAIPCESIYSSSRHIATEPMNPSKFRQVLETRPGYFEELYFQYPDFYSQYKDQALHWLSQLSKSEKEKFPFLLHVNG